MVQESPLAPLSPSMFFSPIAHIQWPSFMEEDLNLDNSTLTREATDVAAGEVAVDELQWKEIRAGRGEVHSGNILVDGDWWAETSVATLPMVW